MKKIECDFCKKIVDNGDSLRIGIGKLNSSIIDFEFDACEECATKLREKAKRGKEGD